MKRLKYIILSGTLAVGLSGCSDYLDIYPENSLPTDKYWQTEADVESTLFAGYYYLRDAVEDYLIPWGELRAGCIYDIDGSDLQTFEISASDEDICTWAPLYEVVMCANLVLANADKALENDDTYSEEEMNSHYCEAYFLRALAYFYIVRNWRDAPLLTEPFETDDVSYLVAKSSDTAIVSQIKSDLYTAIELNAAKESFSTTWETKGRATKWALYALMADVCLWNSDFDECIEYADMILESNSSSAPQFMSTATHTSWFTIFNPGNSNESIFELQWSREEYDGTSTQTNNLPIYFDDEASDRKYLLSSTMLDNFNTEYRSINTDYPDQPDMAVRTMYGGYYSSGTTGTTDGIVWKYVGGTTITEKRTSTYYDPNFIIYRVAEVMLMKAEALIMRDLGNTYSDNEEAVALINQIRERTNLDDVEFSEATDLTTLMEYVLYERLVEFVGEGKAWYDMLRMGRYEDPTGTVDFTETFFINYVIQYNGEASESWIKSVLSDEDAWYLPVYDDEISVNALLTQNPYYE